MLMHGSIFEIYLFQDGLPARLKAIHTINTVAFIDMITSMTKPFMKKELSEKVMNPFCYQCNAYVNIYAHFYILFQLFYHSVDSETIFDHIPREIMPIEFGGSGKSSKIVDGE